MFCFFVSCKWLGEKTWRSHILKREKGRKTVTSAPSTPRDFLFSFSICRFHSAHPHRSLGQPPECQLRTERSQVNLNDKSELGRIAQLLPCSFVTLDRANGLLALLLFASPAACYISVKTHKKLCYRCHLYTHITSCYLHNLW